ncbi:probable peptide/nitrate transporter At3g43790 isoform X3 [Mizuhopecten yessoensis]|uniref:probable peptide/nitrate transporter At3g43790 isoform X3 n=1 Tax=Mizuhopecten yessoensis TaxID=6573 RepID=UPI000B459C4E|nr:probable peptide/nitrate transporter At3g43790 isoform X3 [Mizuhopecten yessoensis]
MDSKDETKCATNGIQLDPGNNTEDQDSYRDGDEVDGMSRRKSSIWMTMKNQIRVGDKGATPLNWKHVFLVFISLFCSALSLTFLFPFLPEMIVGFGYEEEDKGYYAGLVASAVFAGRAVGSYFWGWLSDRYGRRPIMMITVFGNGFFSLVFGFTYNLQMAIISRFLTGLANGTVGTAKTVLYEICDNTNQALGMSIISVAWGAGIVLGPTAGGLLASPVKRYPQSFSADGVFGKFPYLLPSMIIFIVCILVDILDFFLLPETLNSQMGDVRQAVMVYSVFSFGVIGFEEIFTVWASTEQRFDGLNYAPDKIGAVIGISSIPLLVFNLFLFPFLARTFGLKKTFAGCTLVLMLAITVMPMLHLLQNQDTVLMVMVILILLPQKLITACCFSASSLFVNNSAPPNRAGAVNGIAMTMTAFARSLAPAVGGSIFAWSVGYGAEKLGPPFDVNLSFFFFGFVLWTMTIYSFFISDKLNVQKK